MVVDTEYTDPVMAHCELVGTVCVLQVRCMDGVVVGGGGKVVAYVLLMPQKENRAEMCRKWRESAGDHDHMGLRWCWVLTAINSQL